MQSLMEIKQVLNQKLSKKEPYLMLETNGEVRVYDSEKHYYTVITDLGEGNPLLVSLKRLTDKPSNPYYPLYRRVEAIVQEYNREKGLNPFG